MSELSLRALAIRLKRSIRICEKNPTWSSAQKHKPILQKAYDELISSGRAWRASVISRKKEVGEKDVAFAPLVRSYSKWRLSCLAVDPGLTFAEFSSNNTGLDSFDISLDALVDHLSNELKADKEKNLPVADRRFEFAEEALAEIAPLRASYDKEAAEAEEAKTKADDAAPRLAGAQAAGLAAFTTFRQLVRAKFEDGSREASELRNPPVRRKGQPEVEEKDPEVDADLPSVPA